MNNNWNDLNNFVLHWADSKGILFSDNAPKQALKMVSEVGEVCDAYLKGDLNEIKLEIGDVLVTLIIFAKQNDLTLTECLDGAWNKIKDRKGRTVNGTFIKNES